MRFPSTRRKSGIMLSPSKVLFQIRLFKIKNQFEKYSKSKCTTMSYSPEGLFIGEAFRNPGEKVTIIKFREAFGDRNSDHIILVSNGTNEGWVKPSNIQKNVAESNSTDSVYRKIRQSVNIAFAEFMDTIFLRMTDTERENFPWKLIQLLMPWFHMPYNDL
jgi:hypothetical protein